MIVKIITIVIVFFILSTNSIKQNFIIKYFISILKIDIVTLPFKGKYHVEFKPLVVKIEIGK